MAFTTLTRAIRRTQFALRLMKPFRSLERFSSEVNEDRSATKARFHMRRFSLMVPVLILIAMFCAIPASAGTLEGRWLHVRVEERTEDAEIVNVNVPLQFVEAVLPTIDAEELHHGMLSLEDAVY